VNDDDGVLVVVRAGELELELQLVELGGQPGEEGLDLGVGLPLGEELPPGVELIGVGTQALERRQAAL
jgi:hypothetical protein